MTLTLVSNVEPIMLCSIQIIPRVLHISDISYVAIDFVVPSNPSDSESDDSADCNNKLFYMELG